MYGKIDMYYSLRLIRIRQRRKKAFDTYFVKERLQNNQLFPAYQLKKKGLDKMNRMRRIAICLMVFMCIAESSFAQTNSSKLFPSGTSSGSRLLLQNGRIVFTEESQIGVTITCYSDTAELLWSTTYKQDYIINTAGCIWVASKESIALMLKKANKNWEITLIDSEGKVTETYIVHSANQVPIILSGGIFYTTQESGKNILRRLDWNGIQHTVETGDRFGVSMLSWESCNVEGGYALVITFKNDNQETKKKIVAFNNNHHLKWTLDFKNHNNDLYISSIETNSDFETVLWISLYSSDTATPYILCLDARGKKKWEKKVLSEMEDLIAVAVRVNSRGEYQIWGNSTSGSIAFELSVDKYGNYLSHQYRKAESLHKYVNGKVFAEVSSVDRNTFSLISIDAMPIIDVEVPIALLDTKELMGS